MSDRETLARLIDPGSWKDGAVFSQRSSLKAADRILAAGWRPSQPQAGDEFGPDGLTDADRIAMRLDSQALEIVELKRALLAERAAKEAAEREREATERARDNAIGIQFRLIRRERERAEAAEQRAQRLEAALREIGQSGPVNERGEEDAYAGWSWCYERANAALAPAGTTEGGDGR